MKRVQNNNLFKFLLIVAVISMTVVRCTPEKQFRVLSFFFDGVPDPNKKVEDSVFVSKDSLGNATSSVITKPESYLHKPFGENKCKSCHQSEFSNELIKPIPELCYTCHEDFGSKFQTLHGPVVSGNCLGCHNQHEAKYEKLLDREGQDICLYCHEQKQVMRNKVHEKIGTANCTTCHNPHGGDNRGILKKESCFGCHENFAAKYNVLHGPVVSGNCGGCHDSHGAKTPKLLLRESQQICLFCHNADQVFKNAAHKKVKTKNCIECHNPHGGEDRFILTEALRPYKTKPSAVSDTSTRFKLGNAIQKDSSKNNNVIPAEKTVVENVKETAKPDSAAKAKVVEKTVAPKKEAAKPVAKQVKQPVTNTVKPSANTNTAKPTVQENKKLEPSVTNVSKSLDVIGTEIKTQKATEKKKAEPKMVVPFIYKAPPQEKKNVGYAPENIEENNNSMFSPAKKTDAPLMIKKPNNQK